MSDRQFGMERLGMWDGAESRKVVPDHVWRDLSDPASQPADQLAMAIDMAPEGASASIGVAGKRADDRWHVELIEQREGLDVGGRAGGVGGVASRVWRGRG